MIDCAAVGAAVGRLELARGDSPADGATGRIIAFPSSDRRADAKHRGRGRRGHRLPAIRSRACKCEQRRRGIETGAHFRPGRVACGRTPRFASECATDRPNARRGRRGADARGVRGSGTSGVVRAPGAMPSGSLGGCIAAPAATSATHMLADHPDAVLSSGACEASAGVVFDGYDGRVIRRVVVPLGMVVAVTMGMSAARVRAPGHRGGNARAPDDPDTPPSARETAWRARPARRSRDGCGASPRRPGNLVRDRRAGCLQRRRFCVFVASRPQRIASARDYSLGRAPCRPSLGC